MLNIGLLFPNVYSRPPPFPALSPHSRASLSKLSSICDYARILGVIHTDFEKGFICAEVGESLHVCMIELLTFACPSDDLEATVHLACLRPSGLPSLSFSSLSALFSICVHAVTVESISAFFFAYIQRSMGISSKIVHDTFFIIYSVDNRQVDHHSIMYVNVTCEFYFFSNCLCPPVASRSENETVLQVMTFEDLKELGDEEAVKKAGKLRQQGKKYVVQDADVIFFKVGLKRSEKLVHAHISCLVDRSRFVLWLLLCHAGSYGCGGERGGETRPSGVFFWKVVPRRLASFPLAMFRYTREEPGRVGRAHGLNRGLISLRKIVLSLPTPIAGSVVYKQKCVGANERAYGRVGRQVLSFFSTLATCVNTQMLITARFLFGGALLRPHPAPRRRCL